MQDRKAHIDNIIDTIFKATYDAEPKVTTEEMNQVLQFFKANPNAMKYRQKDSHLPYSFIKDQNGNMFVMSKHQLGHGGFGRVKNTWLIDFKETPPVVVRLYAMKISKALLNLKAIDLYNMIYHTDFTMMERDSESRKQYRDSPADKRPLTYNKKKYYLPMPHAGMDFFEFLTQLLNIKGIEKDPKFLKQICLILLIGALRALDKLHQAGYRHRDIKLDNMSVTPKLEVMVIDVDNAEKIGAPLRLVGTQGSYPPEVWAEAMDEIDDIRKHRHLRITALADLTEDIDPMVMFGKAWRDKKLIDAGVALDLYAAIVMVNSVFDDVLGRPLKKENIPTMARMIFDVKNNEGLFRGRDIDALWLATPLICLAYDLDVKQILERTPEAKQAREELIKCYEGFNKIALLSDPEEIKKFCHLAQTIIDNVGKVSEVKQEEEEDKEEEKIQPPKDFSYAQSQQIFTQTKAVSDDYDNLCAGAVQTLWGISLALPAVLFAKNKQAWLSKYKENDILREVLSDLLNTIDSSQVISKRVGKEGTEYLVIDKEKKAELVQDLVKLSGLADKTYQAIESLVSQKAEILAANNNDPAIDGFIKIVLDTQRPVLRKSQDDIAGFLNAHQHELPQQPKKQ